MLPIPLRLQLAWCVFMSSLGNTVSVFLCFPMVIHRTVWFLVAGDLKLRPVFIKRIFIRKVETFSDSIGKLANINKNVLLHDIPTYASCLHANGTLLLMVYSK